MTRHQVLKQFPTPETQWRIVAPGGMIRTPSPVFVGGASTQEIAMRDFHTRVLQVPDAGCLELRNAYVYDYGLIVKEECLLLDRTLTVPPNEIGAWGYYTEVKRLENGRYSIETARNVEMCQKSAVVLLRRGDTVHGHWLLEVLPRARLGLAALGDYGCFIVSSGIRRYQVEMLVALGVREDRIVKIDRGDAIFCEQLFAPSVAHTNELSIHPFANETFNALVKICQGQVDGRLEPRRERLFITRASRSNDPRPLLNVDEIERIAVEEGFWIVDPGVVGWREQVLLFSQASHVVGLSGSGMHNTLFTGSRAHVLTLQPNQNNNFLQTSIAALRGHKVSYLLGESLSGFNRRTWGTSYVIDPVLFRFTLRQIL